MKGEITNLILEHAALAHGEQRLRGVGTALAKAEEQGEFG